MIVSRSDTVNEIELCKSIVLKALKALDESLRRLGTTLKAKPAK